MNMNVDMFRIEAAWDCGYRLNSKQTSDAAHIKVLQVPRFLIKQFTNRLALGIPELLIQFEK